MERKIVMPNIVVLYSDCPAHPMVMKEEHINVLREANKDGVVRWYKSEEEFLADPMDGEVLLAWGRDTPDAVCEKMPSLKWVQSVSAGVEGLQKLKVAKPPLILSKMKAVHGIPMSESAIMYILAFLNGMDILRVNQRKHIWKKPLVTGSDECAHKTVGIVGIGDIGQSVADKCKFFGMTVLGCRRRSVTMPNVDKMYTLDQLDEMLGLCDFVVDLIPATPESHHLFNAERFAHMKSNAVFINIGRGATVDTDALIAALQNGTIYGAALDALEEEPLSAESPLWDMENVIITPHCCADSPYYFDRAFQVIKNNLEHFQKGEPVPTAVAY